MEIDEQPVNFDVLSGAVAELARLRREVVDLKGSLMASLLRRDAIMGPNLVVNHSFEDDLSAWFSQGTPAIDTTEFVQGEKSAKLPTPSAVHSLAFPVTPFTRYRVRCRVKGSVAAGSGLYVRMWLRNAYPPGGFINESNYTGYLDLSANRAMVNSWAHYDHIATPGNNSFTWASIAIYNWTGGPTNAWVDDIYVTPASFTYESVGLAGSWVAYGGGFNPPIFLRNLNGTVSLGGAAKNGTMGTLLMTLPPGCWPGTTVQFPCVSNGAFGAVQIDTVGAVTPIVGSNVHFCLDGITFPTA